MPSISGQLRSDAEGGRQFAAVGDGAYEGVLKLLPPTLKHKCIRAHNYLSAIYASKHEKIVVLDEAASAYKDMFDKLYIFSNGEAVGIICKHEGKE